MHQIACCTVFLLYDVVERCPFGHGFSVCWVVDPGLRSC